MIRLSNTNGKGRNSIPISQFYLVHQTLILLLLFLHFVEFLTYMWSACVNAREFASCSTRAGSWQERRRCASSATRGWNRSDRESPGPTDDDGSGNSGSTGRKLNSSGFVNGENYIDHTKKIHINRRVGPEASSYLKYS